MLALFVLLSPVLVSAVESETTVSTEETYSVVESETDSAAVTQSKATKETPPAEAPQPVSQSSSATSETQAGTSYLYDPGARSDFPKVNTQDGSMQFSYDVKVPQGRGITTPSLTLSYNSNFTAQNSAFGYGWSISIPSIKRMNKQGTTYLYSKNFFESSFDGELVRVSTSTYLPKVDTGSYRKYNFSNNVWTITEKDGTKYIFGSTTQSRHNNPASSTQIYAWNLEEVRDTNSNYASYTYFKDQGQIYPNTITYSGNNVTPGVFSVVFNRQARGDDIVSYETGFIATTSFRINQIETQQSSSWLQRYDLGYTTGANSNRSLLSSVTQSGRDESGVVSSLPSTNFSYETQTTGDKQWTTDASWTIPENFITGYANLDEGVRDFDINGDGLIDIIKYKNAKISPTYAATPSQTIWLNTGTSWATTSTWTLPQPMATTTPFAFVGYEPSLGISSVDLGARFADVNGDGFTDILWGYKTDTTGMPYPYNHNFGKVYLNNKTNGFTESANYALPTDIRFVVQNKDGGVQIADITGDGLPDLLKSSKIVANGSTTISKKVYVNNGVTWVTASTSWSIPELILDQGEDAGTRVIDINGDGLADILRNTASDYNQGTLQVNKTYLNTGYGWKAVSDTWDSPVPFVYLFQTHGVQSLSPRFVDINGDGLIDIYSNQSGSIYSNTSTHINTGEGWSDQSSTWTEPQLLKFTYANNGTWGAETGVRLMDLDGDNMIDFVKSGPNNTYPTDSHEKKVMIHNATVPDLLKTVEYPEGGLLQVSYKQSPLYKNSLNKNRNPLLPRVLNTVFTLTYDDKVTTPYTDTYSYDGGSYFFGSSTNRYFAGFGTTTVVDSIGNITKSYAHQGNTSQSQLGEFQDSEVKIGKQYSIEKFDVNKNLYARTISQWESYNRGSGATYVYKTKDLTQQYDGDTDHKDTVVIYNVGAAAGNLITLIELGEVTSTTTTGAFVDTGTDRKDTTYQYAQNAGLTIIGLPSKETVTNQSAVKVRETNYYYDNQVLGTATLGNVTKKEDWVVGSTYVNTRSTYNSYGLPTKLMNTKGATTSLKYDTLNLYPTVISNPLLQSATSSFDYTNGREKTLLTPNNVLFETKFDGLDRVIQTKKPDPTTGVSTIASELSYGTTRNAFNVFSTSNVTPSVAVLEYQYLDGFGRKIQNRKEAETAGQYAVSDYTYGKNGRLIKASLPYFSNGTNKTSPTSQINLYTSYKYDPLERVSAVVTTIGTTSTAYDQWRQTETNAKGKQKVYVYDAYNNLVAVEEKEGVNTYTTSYLYDLNKNLTKVTDSLGNIRNATYDGLSRRLTLQDLHATADTTFGSWTSSYDTEGNITSITDPKAQVINRTYDTLNRQLTENYTGTAGTELTYAYDTCTKGIGFLCTAKNTDATTTYKYNPAGGVYVQNETVGSTKYTATTTYTLRGDVSTSTYPDRAQVVYRFDGAGNITAIGEKELTGALHDIVTNIDYGPHGQIIYRENGNGVYTNYVYDANALYRLKAQKTTAVAGTGGSGVDQQALEAELIFTLPQSTTTLSDYTGSFATSSTEATSSAVATDFETVETSATSSQSTKAINQEIKSATTTTQIKKDVATTTQNSKVDVPESERIKDVQGAKIASSLLGKNFLERAELKAQAMSLVKIGTSTPIVDSKFGITLEIQAIEKIENGVQVFIRAWKNGKQLGFGPDGSIEIERIRIINPPILVRRNGQLVEDLKVALEESVLHTVASIGQENTSILAGSIGNTTTTVYPASGAISPVDGRCSEDRYPSWTQVRDSLNCRISSVVEANGNLYNTLGTGSGASNYAITRNYTFFDTSAIPDMDAIYSATYSLFGNGPGDTSLAGTVQRVHVVTSNSINSSNIYTSDFPSVGSVSLGESDNSWDTANYNDFPLNATGMSAVSKVGITKFAIRGHYDLMDIVPDNANEFSVGFYFADQAGTTNDPKLIVQHTANAIPLPPILLRTEGVANPTGVQDSTPDFSAIFRDSDVGNVASAYQLQVSASSTNWNTLVWDSLQTTLNPTVAIGARSQEIAYGGGALVPSTNYYWRIKFFDNLNTAGSWSTTTASFSLANFIGIKHLIYNYDVLGNITSISDVTNPLSATANVYTYDDLNRLLTYATAPVTVTQTADPLLPTIALGSNTNQEAYTYNSLGNLLTKTGQGSYIYAGNTASLYANPHAPTSINSVSHTYDQNGNLTNKGTNTYSWHYTNRMAGSVEGVNTLTYTYNTQGQRISKTKGSTVTRYPFVNYEVRGSTTTKQVFLGDTLVTTIENNGSSSKAYQVHPDHLGSTLFTTTEQGKVAQLLSYKPYGEETMGTSSNRVQRHYIGQTSDSETSLDYLNARYYDPRKGEFISQDPVFLSNSQNLANPQSLNSYSYAEGNPINRKDPSGLATWQGSKKAILKSTVKILQSYESLLRSAKADPVRTAKAVGKSAGSSAVNVLFNSGGMTYDAAAATRDSIKKFGNGSDAVQDQMIGNGAVFVVGFFLPGKNLKRIPDDALVVRGGGPSNFAPDKFRIAEHKNAPGVVGFSVQCASGMCANDLASNLPNQQVAQTTVAQIRAAGGDVVATPGHGQHSTVTGLDGQAASQVQWGFFTNPNPWDGS